MVILALVACVGASLPPGVASAPTGASQCGKSASYTAVWEVQGSGDTSPKNGQTLSDLRGVVTATFEAGTGGPAEPRGFYLQAHEADCDDATSDGIFVYTGSTSKSAKPGDLVKLAGAKVTEYGGPSWFRWEKTLTELTCHSGCTLTVLAPAYGIPAAQDLVPPADPGRAEAYHEAREGMLVEVAIEATVVAPLNGENEFVVVRGAREDRIGAESGATGRAITVDGDGVAAAKCGQNGLPSAKTFDRIPLAANGRILGPLAYNFNAYKVQQDDDRACVGVAEGDDASYDPAADPAPGATGNVLTIATFNAENFFDNVDDPNKADDVVSRAAYDRKAKKLADALCQRTGLNLPLVVALQEVENADVLRKLADATFAQCAASYDAHTAGAPDGRGIEVGYLTRADRVSVVSVEPRQGCSAKDRKVDYEAGDAPANVTCAPATPYYLQNRPTLELVVKITLAGSERTVHVFNNHFRSKLPGSSCETRDCTDWRVEEAKHVDKLVRERLAEDPQRLIVVLGDLNDGYDSAPLDELDKTRGSLTNLWDDKSGTSSGQGTMTRYGYIHAGVSQTLDHVLVSDALRDVLRVVSPRHFNADHPASRAMEETMYRVADHDPILVAFDLAPPNALPTAAFAHECRVFDCAFDASASSDPDGSLVAYAWSLGDGNVASGVTVSHTYAVAGEHVVSLTVTDDRGGQSTLTRRVHVEGIVRRAEVTPAFQEAGVRPGGTAWHAVEIRNAGNVPDAYSLAVHGEGAGWSLSLSAASTPTLAPGERVRVELEVRAPLELAGERWGNLTATSAADPATRAEAATLTRIDPTRLPSPREICSISADPASALPICADAR